MFYSMSCLAHGCLSCTSFYSCFLVCLTPKTCYQATTEISVSGIWIYESVYFLSFFNIPIPLLTITNSSFKCSLTFSFSSSLSPKCFWIFTFSTTRLLKNKSGCFGEYDYLEKITSWACLVVSGLKAIFHCSAHSPFFLKSLFSTFAVSKESQIFEDKEVSFLPGMLHTLYNRLSNIRNLH